MVAAAGVHGTLCIGDEHPEERGRSDLRFRNCCSRLFRLVFSRFSSSRLRDHLFCCFLDGSGLLTGCAFLSCHSGLLAGGAFLSRHSGLLVGYAFLSRHSGLLAGCAFLGRQSGLRHLTQDQRQYQENPAQSFFHPFHLPFRCS